VGSRRARHGTHRQPLSRLCILVSALVKRPLDGLGEFGRESPHGALEISDGGVGVLARGKTFEVDVVIDPGSRAWRPGKICKKDPADANGIGLMFFDEIGGTICDDGAGKQPRAVQMISDQVGVATVNDEPIGQHFQYFAADATAILDASRPDILDLLSQGQALVGLDLDCCRGGIGNGFQPVGENDQIGPGRGGRGKKNEQQGESHGLYG